MKEITVEVKQKSGVVRIENFDEIKAYLSEKMEEYRGLQFTEDSKTDAKHTVAALRKLKADLVKRVKEVKKDYLIPFQEFEIKVGELSVLIDEPIAEINKQVKEFEEKRLREKQELIKKLYKEHVEASSVAEMLPLDRIYNQKWENATTTKKAIVSEMLSQISAVENDLSVIRSMQSKYEDKAIEKYRTTMRLSDAINLIQTLERQEKEIEKRMVAEEEHKIKAQIQKTTPVHEEPQPGPEKQAFIPPEPEDRCTVYKIYADPFQCAQIDAFLRKNKIRFEKGKDEWKR